MLAAFPFVICGAFNWVSQGYFDVLQESFVGYAIIAIAMTFWVSVAPRRTQGARGGHMIIGRLVILKWALCSAVAVSVFTLVYAAAAAPVSDGRRLGLRGLKRQRALETNETWRAAEPVVRWIGMRVGGLMSREYRARLQ